VNKLNKVIATATGKKKAKSSLTKKQLKNNRVTTSRYEQQAKKVGNHGGYNCTDSNATAMRMKNNETLRACNVLRAASTNLLSTALYT